MDITTISASGAAIQQELLVIILMAIDAIDVSPSVLQRSATETGDMSLNSYQVLGLVPSAWVQVQAFSAAVLAFSNDVFIDGSLFGGSFDGLWVYYIYWRYHNFSWYNRRFQQHL